MNPHTAERANIDLLVVLNHVFVVRNFVVSGVLRRLMDEGLRTAVVAPAALLPAVKVFLPDSTSVYPLEPFSVSPRRRRVLDWLRLGSFVARQRFPEYQQKVEWSSTASVQQRTILGAWKLLARYRDPEAAADAIAARLRPRAAARRFIAGLRPRLVVWPTTINTVTEFDLVKAASDAGVPIAMCEGSWDNLGTKGPIRPRPQRALVWGEFSRQYAIDHHAFADDQIVVTGPPHFDVYARPQDLQPRGAWCRDHGLDPARPLIFVGGTTIGARMEPALLRMLGEWVAAGDLPPAHIWYRPHPKALARGTIRAADITSIPHVRLDPGVEGDAPRADWVVHRDEPLQRANALAAADVVVSMFSTVVVEGALLGKPALLTEFARDADEARRARRRYRDFGHVRYLATCPGIRQAASRDEFLALLRQLLAMPRGAMASETRQFADTIARCGDGLAQRRIVDAIHTCLNGGFVQAHV